MKLLKITGGIVKLSDKDYTWAKNYTWHLTTQDYAETVWRKKNGKQGHLILHRGLLKRMGKKSSKAFNCDHINRLKLDCRRSNLRVVPTLVNSHNRGLNKNNTSGFKGVYWKKDRSTWASRIMYKYKHIHLGYYLTAKEAAIARDRKTLELLGRKTFFNYEKQTL